MSAVDRAAIRPRFSAQRGACYLCGGQMSLKAGEFHSATRDHVVPKSRVGELISWASGHGLGAANVKLACWLCNVLKASMTLEEFRRFMTMDREIVEREIIKICDHKVGAEERARALFDKLTRNLRIAQRVSPISAEQVSA